MDIYISNDINRETVIDILKENYKKINKIEFNIIIYDESIGVGLFADGNLVTDDEILASDNIFDIQQEIEELSNLILDNFTKSHISYDVDIWNLNDLEQRKVKTL